jgi:hypothetical protein
MSSSHPGEERVLVESFIDGAATRKPIRARL